MALRKTTPLSVIPNRAEDTSKKTTESHPNLFEVDMIIDSKLEENQLTFHSEQKNVDDSCIEKIPEYFTEDLLSRHKNTAGMFLRYCYTPLTDNFLYKVDEELVLKSTPLLTISLITLGFHNALEKFPRYQKIEYDFTFFCEVIPSIFTKEEFEAISQSCKYLIVEFSQQVEKCFSWIIEDIEPQEVQQKVVLNFCKTLVEKNWNTEDLSLQKAAQEVLDVVMPGSRNNDHNIHLNEHRKKLGILPPQRLMVSIDRILNYLDILHYGGFISLPGNNPKDLKFVRF